MASLTSLDRAASLVLPEDRRAPLLNFHGVAFREGMSSDTVYRSARPRADRRRSPTDVSSCPEPDPPHSPPPTGGAWVRLEALSVLACWRSVLALANGGRQYPCNLLS
jgi:hypothetical protein